MSKQQPPPRNESVLLEDDIPPKPKRPLTRYNLFSKLERNYIVQSSQKRTPATSESSDGIDPFLEMRPERYRHVVMPFDWYKVGKNITKRTDYEIHGVISFKGLGEAINKRWQTLDDETRIFCEMVYMSEFENYQKEMAAYRMKYGDKAIQAQKRRYKKSKKSEQHDKKKNIGGDDSSKHVSGSMQSQQNDKVDTSISETGSEFALYQSDVLPHNHLSSQPLNDVQVSNPTMAPCPQIYDVNRYIPPLHYSSGSSSSEAQNANTMYSTFAQSSQFKARQPHTTGMQQGNVFPLQNTVMNITPGHAFVTSPSQHQNTFVMRNSSSERGFQFGQFPNTLHLGTNVMKERDEQAITMNNSSQYVSAILPSQQENDIAMSFGNSALAFQLPQLQNQIMPAYANESSDVYTDVNYATGSRFGTGLDYGLGMNVPFHTSGFQQSSQEPNYNMMDPTSTSVSQSSENENQAAVGLWAMENQQKEQFLNQSNVAAPLQHSIMVGPSHVRRSETERYEEDLKKRSSANDRSNESRLSDILPDDREAALTWVGNDRNNILCGEELEKAFDSDSS